MKPKLTKTEELLESGKTAGLSASEHSKMKEELLSYAKFHSPNQTTEPVKNSASSFMASWWFRTGATFAALVLFIGSGAFASNQSVPGEKLYAVKVNVIEPMVSSVQFSETDKLAYEVYKIEERLEELHTLAKRGIITPQIVDGLEVNIQNSLTDIKTIIDEDSDESIPQVTILEATNDVISILKATEQVVEDTLSATEAEVIEERTDLATTLYNNEIAKFISTESPSGVESYIEKQMIEIQYELDEGDLTSTTTKAVQNYLEDVSEALEAGDMTAATKSISGAMQSIETAEYHSDFVDERKEKASKTNM